MRASALVRSRPETMDASAADHWFSALDQRQIGAGATAWVAQVLGVHPDRGALWVELARTDDPYATVVLHLSPTTSIDEAVAALGRHDRPVEGGQKIIDLVAPAPDSTGWPPVGDASAPAASAPASLAYRRLT